MRVPRIYTDQSLVAGSETELEAGPAHHVAKVLRMQTGRELILFNGRGGEFTATITEAGKRYVRVLLGDYSEPATESPLPTQLMIGISRGERMDWVMQKATELGVSSVQPVFTERTEVKLAGERLEKRVQHWQQTLIGACEQCGRNRLPELYQPLRLAEALASCSTAARYVLHHRTDQQLRTAAKPASVCLLVGPEGGLTDAEIELAQSAGFSALALGPRVMRTETAPVAALAVMQFQWGDF